MGHGGRNRLQCLDPCVSQTTAIERATEKGMPASRRECSVAACESGNWAAMLSRSLARISH
jgi:hypothetical protein